jgi:hypothetical protein
MRRTTTRSCRGRNLVLAMASSSALARGFAMNRKVLMRCRVERLPGPSSSALQAYGVPTQAG